MNHYFEKPPLGIKGKNANLKNRGKLKEDSRSFKIPGHKIEQERMG